MRWVHATEVGVGQSAQLGGRFVACAITPGTPPAHVTVWYEGGDNEAPMPVQVVQTGQSFHGRHLGTVVLPGSSMAWHVVLDPA